MVEELEAFLESKTLLRRLPTLAGGANVAARFSFLMRVPVTAAAAGLSLRRRTAKGWAATRP
jgi:hypothetical protein